MRDLFNFILFVMYIHGIVLAQGFWSTLIAIAIPFWAFYLSVEHLLVLY